MNDSPNNLTAAWATAELQKLWSMGVVPDLRAVLENRGAWTPAELSTVLRVDQRERWKAGHRKLVEEYVADYPSLNKDDEALVDLIYSEYLLRKRLGHDISTEEFIRRFPSLSATLLAQFQLDEMAASSSKDPWISPFEDSDSSQLDQKQSSVEQDTQWSKSPTQLQHLLSEQSTHSQFGDRSEASPAENKNDDSKVKSKVIGRFHLLRKLGKGGMGVVWEAEETTTGRRVALKLLNTGRRIAQVSADQFLREGQHAASFSHPRSAFTYEAGWHDGQPYLVMELMPGSTLRDLVVEKGALAPAMAVDFIIDVIDGVDAAHKAGILHRDIKPSNCFLDADNRAKIGDFGLALPMTDHRQDAFSGTLAFAPPEQLRCEPMDARGDQYSIGATLYFLMAKRPPFIGNATALIAQVAADRAPPLSSFVPDLPIGLERIVAKTIEKDPALRFTDLGKLRKALLPYAHSGTMAAHAGRRISAYVIDETMILMIIMFLTLSMFSIKSMLSGDAFQSDVFQNSVYVVSVASALIGVFLGPLYYLIVESTWGASLGKFIFGLRVVDFEGGIPDVKKIAIRTFVFPAACGLILLDPLAIIFNGMGSNTEDFDPSSSALWSMSITAISKAVQLLCISSIRFKNGFRAWHDIASGTNVIALRQTTTAFAPTNEASNFKPQTDSQEFLGPYLLRGCLIECPDYRLFEAVDPLLKRSVWIHFQSSDLPPLVSSQQRIGRPSRLRWLQGGTQDNRNWNAFEACTLLDLTSAVSNGKAKDWDFARKVLLDLSEELSQAEAEGSLPEVLEVSQLAISFTGRLKLLDFPLRREASDSKMLDPYTGQLRGSHLLCDVARRLQEGNVWPRHAELFCDSLASKREEAGCSQWAANELKNLVHLPTSLRWDDRLGLICMAIASGGYIYPIAILLFSGWILRVNTLDLYMRFAGILLFSVVIPAIPALISGRPPFCRWLRIDLRLADGRRIGRFRCAMREILSWFPWTATWGFFCFIAVLGFLVSHGMESGKDTVGLKQPLTLIVLSLASLLLWVLLIAMGAFAIRFPSRGLVDRMMGTRLIYE